MPRFDVDLSGATGGAADSGFLLTDLGKVIRDVSLAGLPSLPQTLAEAKSYSERFRYNVIEKLDSDGAREAILKPVRDEGADWSVDALEHVVKTSGRYPYFIQQFGQETWNAATGAAIELADARLGVAVGQGQLDNGFFRARWDRTTAAEKQYLRAMCPEGDEGIGSGEVAIYRQYD